jgi:fumarate reductase subunit C
MSAPSGYTPFHPRWHRERVSVWWWLKKPTYALFVLRELTSVAVAFFALVTLWQVRALAQGPEAHARFLERLATPPFLVLHLIALVGVLFHSITGFQLAPKAMVVRLGGKRVPDAAIVGGNYLAWIVLSVLVAAILLRG